MRNLIVLNLVLALLAGSQLAASAQTTKFNAKPGSKVRMEGTSTMHDWQVEGKLIGGSIEAGPNFPSAPGQAATPGKVDAKVEAFIPVRSMTSLKKDGTPYSTAMDDIMYEKLKAKEFPRIIFRLGDLTLKEAPKSNDAPYVFEASGDLAVAGVTNKVTMPVKITPMPGNLVKISGTTDIKMSQFKIDPPAPALAGGLIKTGDDVKLIFDWMVAPQK